jgi:hypothetical protein
MRQGVLAKIRLSDVTCLGRLQIMPLRKALLGTCLALPLAGFAGMAHANSARAERIIRVPAGSVVLVLPGAAPNLALDSAVLPAFPADFPMLRMMAAQDAMMRQMMQQVRQLDRMTMAMPDPAQTINAAMAGMPRLRVAPGTSVVTTMVSNGRGVCRETITYRITPNGMQPQAHVVQSGNDCGALTATGPIGATQTLPSVPTPRRYTAPIAVPHHPRLWTVGDPPHPMVAGVPRT